MSFLLLWPTQLLYTGLDLLSYDILSSFADISQYLNDIRFDLRPNITSSGGGIAYITDSSTEGRNGIIIVDLGTGESWRHLDNTPEVRARPQFLAFVWGEPLYSNPGNGIPVSFLSFGSDGIALSADGETLYWCAVASRYLFGVPTARLRDRSATSEIMAEASVTRLTQKGVSDGLETDSNGFIYMGNSEDNAINIFNPANGTVSVFVRDPRIAWSDTMSVAGNYLYFTENQLWRAPSFWNGTDRRVKPYVLYRVPLPNNGTKVNLQ